MKRTVAAPAPGRTDEDILRSVPLFSGLSDVNLQKVSSIAVRRRFSKDDIIFFENDPGDSLYVVLSGEVRVTVSNNEGKEMIISYMRVGEFFGEMALLDEEPRSATATAAQETELLVLTRVALVDIMTRNGEIAIEVARVLSRRLRKATHRILSLSLLDAQSRVGHLLLELAQESGQKLLDGTVLIRRPPTQEMASMLGTTRETISRALHSLEEQGYLRINGRNIIVKVPRA